MLRNVSKNYEGVLCPEDWSNLEIWSVLLSGFRDIVTTYFFRYLFFQFTALFTSFLVFLPTSYILLDYLHTSTRCSYLRALLAVFGLASKSGYFCCAIEDDLLWRKVL